MKEYILYVETILGPNHWYLEFSKDSTFRIFHRENDKPSYIRSDGTFFYEINGEFHRENNKPAIIHSDGTKIWYVHGKYIKEEV